ncbi:MAG TPA: glyoxalase [Flavobacteriaceae bacterium]|nr:glyoxalase [Flavobacteriaceae bacterium]
MNQRDLQILETRPEIRSAKLFPNMSSGEQFQNKTLRPVIKFQADLLLMAFRNYIQKHKNVFYDLSVEKRLEYVEHAIQKDIKFRNSLKGMVLGQFTSQEYSFYIQDSSALNKRMMGIVIEKIQENIQLLEETFAY